MRRRWRRSRQRSPASMRRRVSSGWRHWRTASRSRLRSPSSCRSPARPPASPCRPRSMSFARATGRQPAAQRFRRYAWAAFSSTPATIAARRRRAPSASRIDAGLAFGSGRHGSTAGCLLALDWMRRRRFANALDIGCGSGVLALAMARSRRIPVVASDIDPDAVAVCRDNARANQVAPRVRAVVASGCRAGAIAAAAPFDLVTANILAAPLRRMAGRNRRGPRPRRTAGAGGFSCCRGRRGAGRLPRPRPASGPQDLRRRLGDADPRPPRAAAAGYRRKNRAGYAAATIDRMRTGLPAEE